MIEILSNRIYRHLFSLRRSDRAHRHGPLDARPFVPSLRASVGAMLGSALAIKMIGYVGSRRASSASPTGCRVRSAFGQW
jgi:hypothetical protein